MQPDTARETYVDRALHAIGRGDLDMARHWRRHVEQIDAYLSDEQRVAVTGCHGP